MPSKKDQILLRILGYQKDNLFYMINLDTGILVCGKDIEESIAKLKDALTVYFISFSSEEIAQQKYIRKAPIKYRLMFWSTLLKFVAHKFKGALFSYNAEYDSNNHNIKFA